MYKPRNLPASINLPPQILSSQILPKEIFTNIDSLSHDNLKKLLQIGENYEFNEVNANIVYFLVPVHLLLIVLILVLVASKVIRWIVGIYLIIAYGIIAYLTTIYYRVYANQQIVNKYRDWYAILTRYQ